MEFGRAGPSHIPGCAAVTRAPFRLRGATQQGFTHRLDKPPAKPLDPCEPQKGIAWILDNPEKLKELREKAKKEERKRGRHMRRSRGLSFYPPESKVRGISFPRPEGRIA